MPFGCMPAIDVDGKILNEKTAINRYLAKLGDSYTPNEVEVLFLHIQRTVGLSIQDLRIAGKDDFEAALMDMIVDQCTECFEKIVSSYFENDEGRKADLKRKLEERFPVVMGNLEKFLEKGTGVFVGDKISWADLALYRLLEALDGTGLTLQAAQYPKVAALEEKVRSHPKMAEYLAKRPPSKF